MAKTRVAGPWAFVALLVLLPLTFFDKWGPAVLGAERYNRFDASGGTTFVWAGLGVALIVVVVLALAKPAASAAGGGPVERRIRARGLSARGTVTGIAEGGGGKTVTVADRPYLAFTIQVGDGVDAPYEVVIHTVVPPEALAGLQPGAVIPLKVDPRDRRIAVIDWQAMGVRF